jgi:hypothetical protein
MWHVVMDVHYNVILSHQQSDGSRTWWDVSGGELLKLCRQAVEKKLNELVAAGHDPKVIELIRWMYNGYIDRWALDDEYDIVSVETTHIVPLGTYFDPEKETEVDVKLKIKVDLLVRDAHGSLWVVDHKSCSVLPKRADFDFMDQFKLYSYGLRQLGHPVMGAIHSAARTKQNQGDIFKPGDIGYKTTMKAQVLSERFDRHKISHTDAQLSMVARNALRSMIQAYSSANTGAQHNADTCTWRCSFTEACLYGQRSGRESDTLHMLEATKFVQEFERH